MSSSHLAIDRGKGNFQSSLLGFLHIPGCRQRPDRGGKRIKCICVHVCAQFSWRRYSSRPRSFSVKIALTFSNRINFLSWQCGQLFFFFKFHMDTEKMEVVHTVGLKHKNQESGHTLVPPVHPIGATHEILNRCANQPIQGPPQHGTPLDRGSPLEIHPLAP